MLTLIVVLTQREQFPSLGNDHCLNHLLNKYTVCLYEFLDQYEQSKI